jgi:hypothetical protein
MDAKLVCRSVGVALSNYLPKTFVKQGCNRVKHLVKSLKRCLPINLMHISKVNIV